MRFYLSGTKSSSSLAHRWGSRGLPRWRTRRGFSPIRQNIISKFMIMMVFSSEYILLWNGWSS